MKYLVIAAIFTMAALTGCETEDQTDEKSSILVSEEASIIVGEGSTVIVGEGVVIEKHPDKPLSVHQIAQDVIHKHPCRVGDTVTIEATVSKGETALSLGLIYLETGDEDVELIVHTDALFPVLLCNDYYKDGGTYEFKLFISGINFFAEQRRPFFELEREDAPIFEIEAELILTEKLEREIREAGCWHDGEQ